MVYSDDVVKSVEYLRLALAGMGRYHIPLDPMNYTLWYEHVSGRNPELSRAIQDIVDKKGRFTPEINRSLFKEYIEDRNLRQVDRIRSQTRSVLIDLLHHDGLHDRFGDILKDLAGRLEKGADAEEVGRVIEDVLLETNAVRSTSSAWQVRLDSASREVAVLKQELDEVKRQALTDGLTGLSNRFDLQNRLLLATRAPGQAPLSLLMFDLDFFKSVNDTYGHLVGDMVLKQAAALLCAAVKGSDTVARFGGEEFVVLLPQTPLEGAVTLGQKICAYFRQHSWQRHDHNEPITTVTISGGATLYRTGENPEDTLRRADEALYIAKQSGRDRIAQL